jgi:hypothetical protein
LVIFSGYVGLDLYTFGFMNTDRTCLGAIIGSACSRHKPKRLGYLQWVDYAEDKTKRGAKQKQCPKCGRWYFGEEF